jgi:ribonuclease HII
MTASQLSAANVDAWAYAQGYRRVAGVDEAGRGAMAGPVVAAAVILGPEAALTLVGDSKQLSGPQRQAAYEEICETALAWAVGVVGAELVDRLNVLRAAHLAMRRAIAGLTPQPDFVLVDGTEPRGLSWPHRAVVHGDALSRPIGAASIIAKVTRDRIMQRLDLLYPGYRLAGHKGYCTRLHQEALRRLGPSPVHRRSFAPVAERCTPRLPL